MTATTAALKPWMRFRFAGSQAELAADPTQNEALEGIVTTVVDCEIETEITLATGTAVDLYAVEQISATMAPQFAGVVNHVAGQSFPNRVVLTCVGPLAHLRRCPTVDHDLTGMTEGAAAKHVLTACNVTYDSADIADSGYTLGAQAPVLWLKDQPGHEMLAELDRVFGMATIEVGAGRVVRFPYDRVPSASAIVKTYTRGADVDFWQNQRDRGDLDAIVNLVQVRGASWQVDPCTLTPWARGSANNADLGGTARNRAQSFQSDLIQDEALATAVATRLMRWGNRQPDTITLVAQNDPTVNCGAVIGVKDQAYGVDLTGLASATPYLVLTIDRRGSEMTLTCVGGAAGVTGTITHGVEKVCNKTSSNFPIPGLFTPPAIGYPPLLDWLPYAAGTDGAPGDADRNGEEPGGGTGGCVTPDAGNWHEIRGSLSYDVGELSLDDMSGHPEAHFIFSGGDVSGSGTAVNPPTIVRISGHVQLSGPGTAGDAPIISIQMQERAGAENFAAFQAEAHPDSATGFFYLYGFGGDFHQTEVTLADLTDGFDVALLFDPVNNLLSMDANDGTWTASVTLGTWTDAEIGILGAAGSALSCDFTNLEVCLNAAVVGDLGDWTRTNPSIWGPQDTSNWTTHIDGTISVSTAACIPPQLGQGIELQLENETIPTAGGWTMVLEGWVSQGPALVEVNIYAGATINLMLATADADHTDLESWPDNYTEDTPGALVVGDGNPWRLTVSLSTGDELTYAWESPIGTTVRSNTVAGAGFVGETSGDWCGISVVFYSDSTPSDDACPGLDGALTRYELTVA